jgi:hypothetical protein
MRSVSKYAGLKQFGEHCMHAKLVGAVGSDHVVRPLFSNLVSLEPTLSVIIQTPSYFRKGLSVPTDRV